MLDDFCDNMSGDEEEVLLNLEDVLEGNNAQILRTEEIFQVSTI